MKFRLLRRRLTISSHRMAVRSALPWPVRWVLGAAMLGFSAAIGLWAFEFGKDIAGLSTNAERELEQLRAEVMALRADRDKAQTVVNTSGSLLTVEKAAQEKMANQIKQLESDNRSMRDDLGVFEKLLPTVGSDGVSVRSLQAELLSATQLKWQVLLIQSVKDAPSFSGKLELTFNGTLAGKPWVTGLPSGAQVLDFKQYRRVEGVVDLPSQAVVKTVTAKVTEGTAVRSVRIFKL